MRHMKEKMTAVTRDIHMHAADTFFASSSSALPMSLAISVPPPAPKIFDMTMVSMYTGSTREHDATMYGLLVRPMNQVSARLYTSAMSWLAIAGSAMTIMACQMLSFSNRNFFSSNLKTSDVYFLRYH